MDDLWLPVNRGLPVAAAMHRAIRKDDALAAGNMRIGGFTNDGSQGRLTQVKVVVARPPHRPEDIPATVGLIADQPNVIPKRGRVPQVVHQLGADQFDRRQRSAQLMRCRRDNAAKVRQFLFACQRHLGG